MKKNISIFFAITYLILSVGVNVNFHYCLGQLDSVEVFITDNDRCCPPEGKSYGCCDDESYFFQLDEDHNVTASERLIEIHLEGIPSQPVHLQPEIEEGFFPATGKSPDPPPRPQPAWVMFCSPIFYG